MVDAAEALKQTIAMLRADYASTLPGTIAEIEALWARLPADDAPAAGFGELVRLVHGIAGTGATFGLDQASGAARELERVLAPLQAAGRPPDGAEREAVAALIDALKQAAD